MSSGETALGTHWIIGWVGVLPGMDTVEMRCKCCDILSANSALQFTYYSDLPVAVNNTSGVPASKRDVMTSAQWTRVR
jgi:hypothetical protein